MAHSDRSLLVFCKQASPGRVKTRLAVDIGVDEAAAVATELAVRRIEQCVRSGATVDVWQSPTIDDAFACPGVREVKLQCDGDLGQRMSHAIETSLAMSSMVVLIGTDCPGIDVRYLTRAFDELSDHDVVIGPAEDGGFGLIGFRREPGPLFAEVVWSTPQVYQTMSERLDASSMSWSRLPLLWDVDRPNDLARYRLVYPPSHGRVI